MKDVIKNHLNNNQNVFVVIYDEDQLIQINKDNIDTFDEVDLNDQFLESSQMTKQNIIDYYSQKFDYNENALSQQEIQKHKKMCDDIIELINKSNDVIMSYHIDSEADVFIIN